MDCPVCGSSAKDITPGGHDGQTIDCPACNPYEITRTVRQKFDKLSQAGRADALEKAKRFKSPDTPRPTISRTCI